MNNDICRCNDHECPRRRECKRYLLRGRGGIAAIASHVTTFRVDNGECEYFVEAVYA